MSNHISTTTDRKGFNRPVAKPDWTGKRFTSAGTLIPASKKHALPHRNNSAYRRWFLDLFATNDWALDVLKFNDVELKDIADHLRDASESYIHDDSVTCLKILSGKTLPIWVKPTIGKTDKRLSRLMGEMMFGAHLTTGYTVKHLTLGVVGEAAFDGMFAKIGIDVFEAVVAETLKHLSGRPAKIVRRHAHKMRNALHAGEKVRVYATTLTREGEGKGHMLIDPKMPRNEVMFVDIKGEVKAQFDGLYIAFNEVHASPLWLDIQTIAMHGQDGRYESIIPDARAYFADLLENIKQGTFDARMGESFERGFEDRSMEVSDGWWLAEYCYSGGAAGWFTTTAKAAIDTIIKQAVKQHGGRRIPVIDQCRYYICNDYSWGTSVPRNRFEIQGASIVVNAVDWITADPRFQTIGDLVKWVADGNDLSALAPGIGKILGGADMDDMIALLCRLNKEGGYTFDVTRSPTFVGEIVEYTASGIVWPQALPKMPGIDPAGRLNIEGRDWKSMVGAVKSLIDLGNVVGCAAKDSRYSIVNLGHLPEGMLAPMSDIVDEVVQFFNVKAAAAREFHAEHSLALAGESFATYPLSRYMADEIMESTGCESVLVAEQTDTGYPAEWFDRLMDQYCDVLNGFIADANELLANVYPPAEFMVAAKPYEPSARLFRQFYGSLFDETRRNTTDIRFSDQSVRVTRSDDEKQAEADFFSNLALKCENFLAEFPAADRPGIVAAAVAIAFGKSAGDEPVKDFIGWQRASSQSVADAEGSLFDYMMRFLRENGLIDQPTAVQDRLSGKERLVKVDASVAHTTYHVPLFGCWAYINGLDPREAKGRKAELLAGDYQTEMAGMTFRVSHEQVMVRGERVTRGIAIDTDSGCVMGAMPDKFDVDSLPHISRIISTFEYDGKLVAVCEDATA